MNTHRKSLTTTHLRFAIQTLPRAVTLRLVQSREVVGQMQRGPSPFMRLNSNPLSRPTLNTFNVKFTIHSAGWRGGPDTMSNTTSNLDTKNKKQKKKKDERTVNK